MRTEKLVEFRVQPLRKRKRTSKQPPVTQPAPQQLLFRPLSSNSVVGRLGRRGIPNQQPSSLR